MIDYIQNPAKFYHDLSGVLVIVDSIAWLQCLLGCWLYLLLIVLVILLLIVLGIQLLIVWLSCQLYSISILEYDGLNKYIPHIQSAKSGDFLLFLWQPMVNKQLDVENQPCVDDVPRETIGFPHLPACLPYSSGPTKSYKWNELTLYH